MRYLRYYLLIVFLLYVFIIVHFVLSSPIWSPIDEIGHYDFIDQLSSAHIPSPKEPISDYTADITIQHFDWIKPSTFNGTKETMGAAGYSYEAQQPPIYYLLLTPPNLVLKSLTIDPRTQIKVLRLINALFEILGAIVGGLIILQLQKKMKFSPLWIWLVPILLIIPNWNWRSSLGNGNLSQLMVNLAFYFAIVSLSDLSNTKFSFLAILFGSFAFLTNYTCILALIGVLALILTRDIIWARNTKMGFQSIRILSTYWPVLLIVLYLNYNMIRYGPSDPLGSRTVEQLFSDNLIQVWGLQIFEQLFLSSYTINFTPSLPNILPVILVGIVLTIGRTIYFIYKKDFTPGTVWAFIVSMTLILTVSSWVMTKVSPTVDWSNFRHFSGYLLLIILISIGGFMRSGIFEKLALIVLSIGVLIPALYYLSVM